MFLHITTLQFYFEFNVKLRQSMNDMCEQLGTHWTLKTNMKDNQMRIAERI